MIYGSKTRAGNTHTKGILRKDVYKKNAEFKKNCGVQNLVIRIMEWRTNPALSGLLAGHPCLKKMD